MEILIVIVTVALCLAALRVVRRTAEHRGAVSSGLKAGMNMIPGHGNRETAPPKAEESAGQSAGRVRRNLFSELVGLDRLQPSAVSEAWASAARPDPEIHEEAMALADAAASRIQARGKVQRVLSEPSWNPGELTQAILEDPELAGEILHVVNSPLYGLRAPMASVTRAMLHLGHVEVRNIIWRVCLREISGQGMSERAQVLMDDLWAHSFVVSRGAYVIAKTLGLCDPDRIATAALMHDIGKSFFLRIRPEQTIALMEDPTLAGPSLLRAEEAAFGFNHTVMGGEAVRIWGLPQEIMKLVEEHHLPGLAPPSVASANAAAVTVLYLADLLYHSSRSRPGENEFKPLYAPAEGWMNLLGLKNGLEDLYSEQLLRIYAHTQTLRHEDRQAA